MSFPATSTPASVVSSNNDLSTLSDIDFPLTLDSFIPILRRLPGVYLDQNLYYIRGSITKADWARLRDYTQMVTKFVVTDVLKTDYEGKISPATFLRLARLQQPDMPLLPSLFDLVIACADVSIAYLDLLLSPSLKSLEATCIPDAQQPTFFSFLTAIEEEAPLLQTLILGPGRFPAASIQIISKFNNLHHLELMNEDSKIPSDFFDNIGSLPKLESLVLDARHVSSLESQNQYNSTEEPTTPTPVGCGFNQLAKLHVIGWLPLLKDLLPRIMSTKLEDVSVTFVRLSNDELKVSLDKEKAEQEKRAELKRKREEAEIKWREEEKLWREQAEQRRKEEENSWREKAEEKREQEKLWKDGTEREMRLQEGRGEEVIITYEDMRGAEECTVKEVRIAPVMGGGKKKGKRGVEETLRDEAKRREDEKEILQALEQEQEKLAHVAFGFYTTPFTELLRMLCHQCAASLKIVHVGQLGRSFQPLFKLPTLPEEMFRGLLLLPAIESLELNGWTLDCAESVLNTAESIANLKSLLLPLDKASCGISLPTLRRVAETCPKLESFQCRIEPLSLIPEYAIPATNALSHGLRMLSVGNSSPLPNPKKLYPIARHLYILFPNLEKINTSEGYNEEQWAVIGELVKMCQTARMDDMNRPSAPITQ